MPFEKGQSGNPKGGKPGPSRQKPFTDALRIAINEAHEKGGHRRLRVIAEKLVKQAEEGNMLAIREIADRLEGKPAQAIIGQEDSPLIVRVQIGGEDIS